MKFKIMDAQELGKAIYEKLQAKEKINVTFWEDFRDDADTEEDAGNFSGAHGIKNISVFDEFNGSTSAADQKVPYPSLLAIGWYGGGTTNVLDCSICFEELEVMNFIQHYIDSFVGQPKVVVCLEDDDS